MGFTAGAGEGGDCELHAVARIRVQHVVVFKRTKVKVIRFKRCIKLWRGGDEVGVGGRYRIWCLRAVAEKV